MTSNKTRHYSGKSQAYIPCGLHDPDAPQDTPVNGSESYIPILVDLAKATAELKQETMSVWRIDIPTGDCRRVEGDNRFGLTRNISQLYTEGYKLFGIFGASGNTGWAYFSNWVEVE